MDKTNSGLKIIKAGTFGYFDVFTGAGWDGHTRVRWNKKVGQLQFVAGKHLSKNLVKTVLDHINGKEEPPVVEAPKAPPKLYVVK